MHEIKSSRYSCPRCAVGRCRPQTATFAEVYHGHLLCIPNRPAFICDVCRFVEFESAGLESLWEELYGDCPADDLQSVLHSRRTSPYDN